jgi:hypothetical protein
MRNHSRYLEFSKITVGEPVVARCSICKRDFVADPRPNERMDDVILRLRAEFAAHHCHELSPTAAN